MDGLVLGRAGIHENLIEEGPNADWDLNFLGTWTAAARELGGQSQMDGLAVASDCN